MVVLSLSYGGAGAGSGDDGSTGSSDKGGIPGMLLRLQKLKRFRHDRVLNFQHIPFTNELVQAVVDLLSCDGRKWERIHFSHCSGPIHIILSHVLQLETVHALELVDAASSSAKLLDSTTIASSMPASSSSSSSSVAALSSPSAPFLYGKGFNNLLTNKTSLNKLRLRVGFSETYPDLPPELVLQLHPNLQELDVSGTWFLATNVPILASALARNKTLRIIRLKFFASLGDEEIARVVTALEENPSLQGLEIGQYSSGSITLAAIAKLIANHQQQIQHQVEKNTVTKRNNNNNNKQHCLSWLRIRHQALRNDQVPDLSPLATALSTNKSLTSLDLSLTTVSDIAMEELGRALHTNTTLRHLFLNHCAISSTAIQSFCANHLPHMKGLKTLDLTGNHLEHGDDNFRAKELILEGVRCSNWELEHISLQAGDCILSKEIGYYLDLNRSGRQLLNSYGGVNNNLYIPPSLWPLVLERADKKIMLRVANDGPADRRERRASVLYFILREHVLLERQCHS